MLQLNKSNYHSVEADREYMSRSQYLGFMSCEAKEFARLKGEWTEEKSDALLVGSYVHAWNDGTREQFKKETPEMFTKAGELKAQFKTADKMIEVLEKDPLCMFTLQGEKEVIIIAEFAGVVWKVMIDSYNREKRRKVDLKTTKSIREKHWNADQGQYVSFIENYKYPFQAAIYSEIERIAMGRPEGDWGQFFIVAVSKESCPDKEVIDMFDRDRYIIELEQVKVNMPRILAVKAGEIEPVRCERCDYCRSTRQLTGTVHYTQLIA
jgi:hypothetical protein